MVSVRLWQESVLFTSRVGGERGRARERWREREKCGINQAEGHEGLGSLTRTGIHPVPLGSIFFSSLLIYTLTNNLAAINNRVAKQKNTQPLPSAEHLRAWEFLPRLSMFGLIDCEEKSINRRGLLECGLKSLAVILSVWIIAPFRCSPGRVSSFLF